MEIWSEWFALEQNRPSRSDHYLMNIAAEIRRGNVKNPRAVKLDHFKIPFERKRRRPMTKEEATAIAKARWGAMIPKESRVPLIPVRTGDEVGLKEE